MPVKMGQITFLGNAGGRMATYSQLGPTGGFVIQDKITFHVDPGPGALLLAYKHKLDPRLFDGVIVSHCHPDHYNDAEILIEAITEGCKAKRGFLVAPKSVISGNEHFDSPISSYHRDHLDHLYAMDSGDIISIQGIQITATKSFHNDSDAIGFKFKFQNDVISYISDTEYFPELASYHGGADILILTLTRPDNLKLRGHMCTNEAINLIQEIGPKKVILTHFGMRMFEANPETQARLIENETGVNISVAEVGRTAEFS